ncbi:hypothetical protein GWK47_043244 [Chionoecetes opilio]|uniref:Uncharacterized protein n=1 Tax=Chionoecetes opilio TaxID=41210 RepID=A0A8J4Y9F8_CHIOP|nr:hypothetical protein GWK47_043244 [Chionoecetes opilio]
MLGEEPYKEYFPSSILLNSNLHLEPIVFQASSPPPLSSNLRRVMHTEGHLHDDALTVQKWCRLLGVAQSGGGEPPVVPRCPWLLQDLHSQGRTVVSSWRWRACSGVCWITTTSVCRVEQCPPGHHLPAGDHRRASLYVTNLFLCEGRR